MKNKIIQLSIIFILCFIYLSGCSEKTYQSDKDTVYAMSQEFLEDILVAPATAQYPDISEATIKQKTNNKWAVLCYVDSQNSFGALIRSWYACEMVLNTDDTWGCLYINLEDNKIDANLKWSIVRTFTGSEDRITDSFTINTNIWSIEWETGGADYSKYTYIDPSPMFWFTIYNDRTSSLYDSIFGDGSYDSGIEYYTEGNSQFYLDINAFDLTSWAITVNKAEIIV